MPSAFTLSRAKGVLFDIDGTEYSTVPANMEALGEIHEMLSVVQNAAASGDADSLANALTVLIAEDQRERFHEDIKSVNLDELGPFAIWLAQVMRGNPTRPPAPPTSEPDGTEPSTSPAPTGSPSADGVSLPESPTPSLSPPPLP